MNSIRCFAILVLALVMPFGAMAHSTGHFDHSSPKFRSLPLGAVPSLKVGAECGPLFTPGYEMTRKEIGDMLLGVGVFKDFFSDVVVSLDCITVNVYRDPQQAATPEHAQYCLWVPEYNRECETYQEFGLALSYLIDGPGGCEPDNWGYEFGCLYGAVSYDEKSFTFFWWEDDPNFQECLSSMQKIIVVLHEMQHFFAGMTHGRYRDEPESVAFYEVQDFLWDTVTNRYPELWQCS